MTCWELIKSDLYRHYGRFSWGSFLRGYFLIPGFRFMVWLRFATATYNNKLLGWFPWLLSRHYAYLFGIDIPRGGKIGKGFYIGHFSGIVISPSAIIGDNCNISQGVTIGVSGRGDKRGSATIGYGVYIGLGAKIVGKVTIGDNVALSICVSEFSHSQEYVIPVYQNASDYGSNFLYLQSNSRSFGRNGFWYL